MRCVQQGGDANVSTSPGEPHHPRFLGLQAEEHHLVTGPKRKEAAQVKRLVIIRFIAITSLNR